MSDPGPLVMGVELGYESVDPDCGAWIDKALRWRGPDNAKVRSSVFGQVILIASRSSATPAQVFSSDRLGC
jgi:hypothetical protein